MMKTMLISNNPEIAVDAAKAGVSRVMVDLEWMGKKERQASRNTFISTHTADNIAPMRKAFTGELVVRINPWHEGSAAEVETAIVGGADIIMLPMITELGQLDALRACVQRRAEILPLVETKYSMEHLAEIAANPAIKEVYIGLNDLHLSLGLNFLFEPLAMGLMDDMAAVMHATNKSFGFGGIAMMGSGELPAEKILAEHVRLGSTCVILSSRFCKDVEIERAEGRLERLKNALNIFHSTYQALQRRSPAQASVEFEQTAKIIRELTAR